MTPLARGLLIFGIGAATGIGISALWPLVIGKPGAKETPQATTAAAASTALAVYFSPDGGCTAAVVKALGQAKQSVRVQAYSFTSAPIAEALVQAHRRGVEVQVILDKSQRSEQYSSADFLAHAGVATFIDAKHAIAHNKVMVIDGEMVITGSFNFTKAAEQRNAENLLVVTDRAVAAKYSANWELHLKHSEAYAGR